MDLQFYKNQASIYKRIVGSRYISVDPDKIETRIPNQDAYYVSTKYDGHSSFLCYEKGKPLIFVSQKGGITTDLDLNKKAKKLIDSLEIDQLMVAGMLYLESNQNIPSINLTKAITNNDPNIKFVVYDLILINQEPTFVMELKDVIEKIEELFPKKGLIHCANNQKVENRKNIDELFQKNVALKKEGIIVKTDDATFKIKPKYTFEAIVVGFADNHGERKGMFRDLLLAFIKSDGSYQIIGHLHHGFSDEERKTFTNEMQQEIVSSKYIEVARNKTPFHFIKPKFIVEFSCLDIITEGGKAPITKMNLNYNENTGYRIIGNKNSISLTHANFIRFRIDKEITHKDANFNQVSDIVSYSEVKILDDDVLKKSEILKRVVYTKESRGNLMIKKLVLIKTNKENTFKYPAYVLHLTDFSSGRKDPLKRDLSLTNDEEQANKLFDQIITKNIKSGWILFEG